MSLKGSLINTIYLTFEHNQIAIAFFMGILICLALALYKPSRSTFLLVIAFIILLLGFEYDKHIANPLQEQTLQSLNLETSTRSFGKLVSYTLSVFIPIGLFVTGWGIIFLTIINNIISIEKLKKQLELYKKT